MKYISHKNISDCLCLLWKIVACYLLLVNQSLLFPKINKFFQIILTNDKQRINYFPKYQVLDDQRNFACYFKNSRFQTIRAKIEKLLISHKITIRISKYKITKKFARCTFFSIYYAYSMILYLTVLSFPVLVSRKTPLWSSFVFV